MIPIYTCLEMLMVEVYLNLMEITIFFTKVRIDTIGILSNSRCSSGQPDTLIIKTKTGGIDPLRYFKYNFNHQGRSTMIFINLHEKYTNIVEISLRVARNIPFKILERPLYLQKFYII